MAQRIYDPTGEVTATERLLASRKSALGGLRLGVLDNSKWNAGALLRDASTLLRERCGIAAVNVYRKDGFSRPAFPAMLNAIAAENDIAITAIGDCGSCTSSCTHDAIELEALGIPTALIVTAEFAHESKMQSLALGMSTLVPVVIEHPLSTLKDREILERAHAVAEQAEKIWLRR